MNISKCVREVVFDSETTGLNYEDGDRIIEIACVELANHVPTGNVYQTYINPQRDVPKSATAIHGITNDLLTDKPLFHEIVDDFLDFVKDSKLVIHNVKFDLGFLNSELRKINKPLFSIENTIDTLEISRKKFPGMPVNLDALCRKFEIDLSSRTVHGALVDSKLLAEVYINLLGGRQSGLSFATETSSGINPPEKNRKTYEVRHFPPSQEEISMHAEFLKGLNSPLWNE
ncbi:MAG: DNA polymerase III subunit epsilon [Holosporaceae bacterium]|jgi:DNA polymerase-3 subunit epsilon|nr:DNA polymerase III subunit epsilon [Holosporaceae bacterium]